MPLFVQCVPAPDSVPVAPCGSLNGVALAPVVTDVAGGALDYSGLGALFAWTLSFVLIAFAVGVGVGSIVRVIKSA